MLTSLKRWSSGGLSLCGCHFPLNINNARIDHSVLLCSTSVLSVLLPLFPLPRLYLFLHMLIFPVLFFSLKVGYHPYVIYCFHNIGKVPTKTGLRPPHPDLNIFHPHFKGTTCFLCICLILQQPPSCIKNKAKTVGFPIIILYLSLFRKPCPFFRHKIIRFHIF